jgi:hypothetical protein
LSKGCSGVYDVWRLNLCGIIAVAPASVSLWRASLLNLVHRSHDGLVDLGADLFNFTLAVEGAADSVIGLNKFL